MEDVFLNFPDRSSSHRNTHWSDLFQRSEILPGLKQDHVLRVFVTSGQTKGCDSDRQKSNNELAKQLWLSGRLGTTIQKPTSGIFDLWKVAGLKKKLQEGRNHGQAKDYLWPPIYANSSNDECLHDHSAPGKLLEIARKLEDRARKLRSSVQNVIHAVHGAVLSVDAMELLGEKAQTTFLEALVLKHEFETVAECQFIGVQSHFDVDSRMNEVKGEVHELGRYFKQTKRKEAEWNAEAQILNCLIQTYRDCNQFDEELAIQRRDRVIQRRLWFKKHLRLFGDQLRWFNPFYWIVCYIHGLLKSIPVFVLAIIVWVAGLSILYTSTSPDKSLNSCAGFYRGVEDAVTSFFSLGGPIRENNLDQINNRLTRLEANTAEIHTKINVVKYPAGYVAVICLAIVAGFLHLGIFISNLYSSVTRK
jgi:hypothetical protein